MLVIPCIGGRLFMKFLASEAETKYRRIVAGIYQLEQCSTLIIGSIGCQSEEPLFNIIDTKHKLLRPVLKDVDKYEVQIRYTQNDRDANGTPSFRTISFNNDSVKYF